jgi:cyanophycinase
VVRTSQNQIETSNTSNDFEYRLECGKVNSNSAKSTSGILLIGGAEGKTSGEDAATRWFLNLANGGDFLVLRSGRIGKQASWIADNYRDFVSSAAELSINSRDAANNPQVIQYIRDADALFIAGGNQSQYEDYWEGTGVEDAINYLINQKQVPVAGTSAGMAILGDSYYAPAHQGVTSSEILNNPFHYNAKNIYRSDFIRIPFLKHTITDTHLDRVNNNHPETRYGRIFGFVARVACDYNQLPVYGIGLEEGAFVTIDEKGIAKVFGNGTIQGQDAYFLQTNGIVPEQIQPDLPLIWNHQGEAVKVYKISGTPEGSGNFDLNNWANAVGGSWEYWFTTGGASGFQRKLI